MSKLNCARCSQEGVWECICSDPVKTLEIDDIDDIAKYVSEPAVDDTAKYVSEAPEYKYKESDLVKDLLDFIDSTYTSKEFNHYARERLESVEITIDAGHGMGFVMGSINKYWKRYGKKEGCNRKDLLKMLHYGIMALYIHDKEIEKYETKSEEEGVRESYAFKYGENAFSVAPFKWEVDN